MTIPRHFPPDEHPRDTLHEFGIRFHGHRWYHVAEHFTNGIPLPEGSGFHLAARVAQFHQLMYGPGTGGSVTGSVFIEHLSSAISRNRLPLLSINCIDPVPDTQEVFKLAALRWMYGSDQLDVSHLRGVRNLCVSFYEYICRRAQGLACAHVCIDIVLGRVVLRPPVLVPQPGVFQFNTQSFSGTPEETALVINTYPPPQGHHSNPPKWAEALLQGLRQPSTVGPAADDDEALWREYMVPDEDDVVKEEPGVKDESMEIWEAAEPNEGDMLQGVVKSEESADAVVKDEPMSPKREPATPEDIKPPLPTPSPTPTPSPPVAIFEVPSDA
ncbi:uncharacterized protein LOC62_03G005167 [Vanrija pseudolonga]|uniref:Uncharacterized protein n=1 Tax=Vanrija pseudolonga TaxID=143232 RepID=A0AAF1BM45_9TREE|nr:hypothetical protein LOC62_03G005167 [Vanrija pseudolonga]